MGLDRSSHSPEISLSRRYINILEASRGQLSLEECRSLFREVNRFLIPYRDERLEPEEGTLPLLIMLGANTGSTGPLDKISKFVETFGSAEANAAFLSNRPQDIRASWPELSPEKTPVNIKTVTSYLRRLLEAWLGLT